MTGEKPINFRKVKEADERIYDMLLYSESPCGILKNLNLFLAKVAEM